jgi:DNA-binding transcriptional LysR family regulator
MNILHMKYAVEVARAGSINKASEALLIAQPNLSRSIKELEADLGITIFDRSAKGMVLTPEGVEFINHAKDILKQINHVEMLYKNGAPIKRHFSISAPGCNYITEAFSDFSREIHDDSVEIFYKEADSTVTVQDVMEDISKLGIIRCISGYDGCLQATLMEKDLTCEPIGEFTGNIIMSASSPLADLAEITMADLENHTEIVNTSNFVTSVGCEQAKQEESPFDSMKRRIYTSDRAMQFALLSQNSDTFMRSLPASDDILSRLGLVIRQCPIASDRYKDILIYRNEYKLTELDNKFIKSLFNSRDRYLNS